MSFQTTFGDMLQDVMVRRPSGSVTRVKGRTVQPGEASVSIRASVQPYRIPAEELQALPELERSAEALKLYTEDELFTVNAKAGTPADIVEYSGNDWKVIGVSRNEQGIIDHYKIIAQRTRT
jgi:hypothetical protein